MLGVVSGVVLVVVLMVELVVSDFPDSVIQAKFDLLYTFHSV